MTPAERSHSPSRAGGAEPHPLDWVERAGASDALLHELATRRDRRARRRRAFGAVAGVAALLALGGIHWRGANIAPVTAGGTVSSAVLSVPERRVLPDGSIVELKTGAAIAVAYTARERRVALTAGEAHFEVAKNGAIPFVVAAAGVEVRAVGTAFSVHATLAAVEVLVTEGRVAVEDTKDKGPGTEDQGPGTVGKSSDRAENRPVVVGAGNRVLVESVAVIAGRPAGPQVTELSAAEMNARLAWRVPRIEFSGTPLGEAIPMFNRHSPVRVSLGDPALERLLLSGILRADNVDALVRLLGANYPIAADRLDNEIVLRKREPGRMRP